MILEVSELSKEFVNKSIKISAVDKVSFKISSGELASIIGPSGSGKSTLFHMIGGIQKPTGGRILYDYTCINDMNERTIAGMRNKKIGYILQEQNLLLNYTVLENICMPHLVKGRRKVKHMINKAEILLEQVGLLRIKNSYPNEISGGEARRVAIARALINEPDIILADEPTSNLDLENSTTIMELFKKISNNGVAVLISTHDLQFLNYSDKVFVMKQGRLEEQLD